MGKKHNISYIDIGKIRVSLTKVDVDLYSWGCFDLDVIGELISAKEEHIARDKALKHVYELCKRRIERMQNILDTPELRGYANE